MGSSDDFWNDIYGDLYDFNGDGKTDFREVQIARHIDEQGRKKMKEKADKYSPHDDIIPEYREHKVDYINNAFVYEDYSEYFVSDARFKIPHNPTKDEYNKASKSLQGYKSETVMVIIFLMLIVFVVAYVLFSVGGVYFVFFGIVALLIGGAIVGIVIYASRDDFKRIDQLQEILDQKYRESKKRK